MDKASASMRDLAERLLALEAAKRSGSDSNEHVGAQVCDKLRISLTRFAGTDGFTALLRRALALARADAPSLQSVKVSADGHLEGLEQITADAANVGIEPATIITAHLLGLLATFIGEPLTLGLVRQAWPEASLHE
jgi:hypothetical protein